MSPHGEGPDADQPYGVASGRMDKAGLLIIRAWVEEGSFERLRAEVRSTTDVSAGIEGTLTFARTEEVGAAVQEWLANVLGDSGPLP